MKTVVWLLAPLLLLLAVPLAVALMITTLAAPLAAAATPPAGSCASPAPAGGTMLPTLPSPGEERRASLTNPPTAIPATVFALYQQGTAARIGDRL